jgi:hypothetical protein
MLKRSMSGERACRTMALWRWGLASLVFLLAGAPSCATGPAREAPPRPAPPEDAREYYPLEPGWRWAYDVERGAERILAVYAVRERHGEQVVVEAAGELIHYAVFDAGIARTGAAGEADKRGQSADFLIKSPVRPGASWLIEGGRASVTAVGRSVTVPAGTFENCLVVEEARGAPPRLVRTTYAPRVGPVAIESLAEVPGRGYEPTLRATLRGVTRPGEDPLR